MKFILLLSLFFVCALSVKTMTVNVKPIDERTVCANITNPIHKQATIFINYAPIDKIGRIGAVEKLICQSERCDVGVPVCHRGLYDCFCNNKK